MKYLWMDLYEIFMVYSFWYTVDFEHATSMVVSAWGGGTVLQYSSFKPKITKQHFQE